VAYNGIQKKFTSAVQTLASFEFRFDDGARATKSTFPSVFPCPRHRHVSDQREKRIATVR
jgi:hypothetical protein